MTTILACVLVLTLGQAADTRVIASTKDWSITAQQFEQILGSLPDQARDFYSQPENRRHFLDQLIQMWVMSAEARTKGTDKDGKLKAMTEFYGNNLVAREYMRQIQEGSKVTDETISTFYENNPADFTQVKLSHILILNSDNPNVRNEKIEGALPRDEAMKRIEEVKTKMRDGADFEDLAKKYSQDPGSAAKGGDLGYIQKGQLAGEVEKAAFALQAGAYSDIIESPFGFHILHVTETKVSQLDQVRDQIRQRLNSEQTKTEIDARVKAAGVKVDESFFKP